MRAGADIVSVADTTGAMIPGSPNNLHDYITRLKFELSQAGLSPRIAVTTAPLTGRSLRPR